MQANVEITSRYDGVVHKINYKVGEMAAVGSSLINIEVEGAETPAVTEKAVPVPETPVAPTPVHTPPPVEPATVGSSQNDYLKLVCHLTSHLPYLFPFICPNRPIATILARSKITRNVAQSVLPSTLLLSGENPIPLRARCVYH